jgi:hypothetical protein
MPGPIFTQSGVVADRLPACKIKPFLRFGVCANSNARGVSEGAQRSG